MAKSEDIKHTFRATDVEDHYAVVQNGAEIGYVVKDPEGNWRAQDHNHESIPGDVVHRTRELAAAAIDYYRATIGLD